ncbi:hypothetical protein KI387_018639, partial [Taxus chinensis]
MFNHEEYRLIPRHRSSRCRHDHTGTAIVLSFVLFVSVLAWMSMVFMSQNQCFHKTEQWQGNPISSLSWPAFETSSDYNNIPATGFFSLSPNSTRGFLALNQVVFGIAGSVDLWVRRKEFVRLWWRPDEMRGHVWLEEAVLDNPNLPPVRVSEDISRFSYTNPTGNPSGVRIARIILESFKLGLPDVKWFVLGDDDTIFNVENLIRVLSKYDSSEMYYIGSTSESHSANTFFSHSMGFGGGGIAISYPLAETLSEMLDECLERYPRLFGSDDRLHACISEIGVPLTREPGFHQWDIRGNAHGLLSAHPITPFVSFHHVEAIDPIFPQHNSMDGLRLFMKAMRTDPSGFLQQSICYDHRQKLTFSISSGYVAQVFPKIVLPRELERSERTYTAWNKLDKSMEFDFDTKTPQRSYCKMPFLFFLEDMHKAGNMTASIYSRDKRRDNLKKRGICFSRALPQDKVQKIHVVSKPMDEYWHL